MTLAIHPVKSSIGGEFKVVIGKDGRIDDVIGDWPAPGVEFELLGPVPEHAPPAQVPEHLVVKAAERDREVCFADPDGCRTCFCDSHGHMHCIPEC